MYIITKIPHTNYRAIWNTVTDRFLEDANGDQGWSSIDDMDLSHIKDEFERLEVIERISILWG